MFPTFCVLEHVYHRNWGLFHLFWQVMCNYFRRQSRWTSRISGISLDRMCPCWNANICYHCRHRDVIFEVQRWARWVSRCLVASVTVKICHL